MRRRTCLKLVFALLLASLGVYCDSNPEAASPPEETTEENDAETCERFECAEHASCAVIAGRAVCSCDQGYVSVDGASCVTACTEASCSGHGTCSDSKSGASCSCDSGYVEASGLQCVPSELAAECVQNDDFYECNPFSSNQCTDGLNCSVTFSGFICDLPIGEASVGESCTNEDEGVHCGAGLFCLNGFCAAYCCSDEDCGAGKCNLDTIATTETIGFCESELCGDAVCSESEGCTTCPSDCGECAPLPACATIKLLYSCNPMDGSGCDLEGLETCDFSGVGWDCFPPPNEAGEGDACDLAVGPYCGVGLSCDNNLCRRYCCSDDDCPSPSVCAGGLIFGNGEAIGLCLG